MSETNASPVQFTLHIDSPDDDPVDSVWQSECRQLYHRLVDAMEEGDLRPVQQQTSPGEKGDIFEVFHQIIAYGISINAFAAIYQVAQLWLEHRPRCDVVLKFPDGSEIKLHKMSLQEAQRLMQEHQQKFA